MQTMGCDSVLAEAGVHQGQPNCGGYGVEAFSIAIKARLDKFFNAGETKFEGDCL
jgi:hypothetical protein